jgi:hypothetical protein
MATTPERPGAAPLALSFADGRDELNLADFPISVLQRQPPRDAEGRKLDQVVYESTTYDPVARRRVPQRVTLTTSSRYGLPTPADENVILALLYTAKRAHDFAEPRVHFSPHQLFGVMRWDANSRSYERLSQVLLRLKSLTLLYENAWWDPSGHRYQEEFATGVVAEYRLVKTKVRRKQNVEPPSYVHWTPQFHKSLASGNLKKLDLDRLFALTTPTAQRMYRFLDKRFYNAAVVEMDLRDFACGHLGVTAHPNVAELKRRLAPAVAELEAIGFLERIPAEERYFKYRKGIWRVRFHRPGGGGGVERARGGSSPVPAAAGLPSPARVVVPAPAVVPARGGDARREAGRLADASRALVLAFYQAWTPGITPAPTEAELARAHDLVVRHGPAGALDLIAPVVALLRLKFPDARRFGAAVLYFEEAAATVRRRQATDSETARRLAERQEAARRQSEDAAFFDVWTPAWNALSDPEREAIQAAVLLEHPYLARPLLLRSRLATRFFLEELARRRGGTPESSTP